MTPARESIRAAHYNQVEEHHCQSEVQALNSLLYDMGLSQDNKWDVEHMGEYSGLAVALCPVKGSSTEELRVVSSQTRA